MEFLAFEHLLRMSLELVLAVSLKLFCDHGRIHWRDLAADFLFWLPGAQPLPGDGLFREVAALLPAAAVAAHEPEPIALAAK